MVRLTHPDTTGHALSVWPDAVTPSLLDEYQLPPTPVERAGETRRVLAACLKCCWHDLSVDPWPGEPAPAELILDTYRALIGRTDDLMRNWAVGALRRLHESSWITLSDGVVRLGARCTTWPQEAHAQLQELVRRIPEAPRTTLTVVQDTDIIAAITIPPLPHAGPATAAPIPTHPETTAPSLPHEESARIGHALPQEATATAHPPLDHALPEASQPAARSGGHDGPPSAVDGGADGSQAVEVARGGRVEGGESADFDDLLDPYDERRRAELVAAFMAVEHAAEPVQEAKLVALRDPALRHTLAEMLARRGRVLIQHRERWTSGYDDTIAAQAPTALGVSERAVLTLVLVHSVAIPRAEGVLPEDTWLSPHPAPVEELRRHTQVPIGELDSALRSLRHAGLLSQVKAGEEAGGYVPGPQFHRLTPAARRRLQEELILAAGPHTPLATAVRARRSTE